MDGDDFYYEARIRMKVNGFLQEQRQITLHGAPMLADKTNFGLVLYNHANFYWFGETLSYWSVK